MTINTLIFSVIANGNVVGGVKRLALAFDHYDLRGGTIPLPVDFKVSTDAIIREAVMFLSGRSNVIELQQNGVTHWDGLELTQQSAKDYYDDLASRNAISPEHAALSASMVDGAAVGEIGPMYGNLWRFWPTQFTEDDGAKLMPMQLLESYPLDELPKQLVEDGKVFYEQQKAAGMPDEMDENNFILSMFHSVVDQLALLIMNLRRDPYGLDHHVTSMNPSYYPIIGVHPAAQPLLNRGSIKPTVSGFQIVMLPPTDNTNKMRLTMKLDIMAAEVMKEYPHIIGVYALLAQLIAKELGPDVVATDLSVNAGVVYLMPETDTSFMMDASDAPEQTARVVIKDEGFSLFSLKPEDIQIVDVLQRARP